MEERRKRRGVLTVSLELELRRVREGNAFLAAAVNEYRVRVKNLEKLMDEIELNRMALLR